MATYINTPVSAGTGMELMVFANRKTEALSAAACISAARREVAPLTMFNCEGNATSNISPVGTVGSHIPHERDTKGLMWLNPYYVVLSEDSKHYPILLVCV